MGEIYFRSMFGRSMFGAGRRPRVGLLSIGEEETKGNLLTRESFQLLKRLPVNFVGNVEGRDLFNGHVDVIVADGFVGNVALKVCEGVADLVRSGSMRDSLEGVDHRPGRRYAIAQERILGDFKQDAWTTPEYGGAPLLGVQRRVHHHATGRSNANAIKNAVRVAAEFSERNINKSIEQGLAALRPAPAPVEGRHRLTNFSHNQHDDRIKKRAPRSHSFSPARDRRPWAWARILREVFHRTADV